MGCDALTAATCPVRFAGAWGCNLCFLWVLGLRSGLQLNACAGPRSALDACRRGCHMLRHAPCLNNFMLASAHLFSQSNAELIRGAAQDGPPALAEVAEAADLPAARMAVVLSVAHWEHATGTSSSDPVLGRLNAGSSGLQSSPDQKPASGAAALLERLLACGTPHGAAVAAGARAGVAGNPAKGSKPREEAPLGEGELAAAAAGDAAQTLLYTLLRQGFRRRAVALTLPKRAVGPYAGVRAPPAPRRNGPPAGAADSGQGSDHAGDGAAGGAGSPGDPGDPAVPGKGPPRGEVPVAQRLAAARDALAAAAEMLPGAAIAIVHADPIPKGGQNLIRLHPAAVGALAARAYVLCRGRPAAALALLAASVLPPPPPTHQGINPERDMTPRRVKGGGQSPARRGEGRRGPNPGVGPAHRRPRSRSPRRRRSSSRTPRRSPSPRGRAHRGRPSSGRRGRSTSASPHPSPGTRRGSLRERRKRSRSRSRPSPRRLRSRPVRGVPCRRRSRSSSPLQMRSGGGRSSSSSSSSSSGRSSSSGGVARRSRSRGRSPGSRNRGSADGGGTGGRRAGSKREAEAMGGSGLGSGAGWAALAAGEQPLAGAAAVREAFVSLLAPPAEQARYVGEPNAAVDGCSACVCSRELAARTAQCCKPELDEEEHPKRSSARRARLLCCDVVCTDRVRGT